ncbi:hypothetical protein E8E12_000554 [Didymella heteroderae]|uniref:Mediator of RNA polymerase II transcription subunit 20 n=1 Tax=Didymella heteroderae TaxID=1769908 RepID=A0A9P4WIV7_9PLEO|nr:hypothetical protein E8E12_000554 [Didymella heteroderae]
MKLYFVPTPTAQPADSSTTASSLVSALETLFPALSRAAPWALTYRLFRDTAPRTDPSDTSAQSQYAHTYQHLLTHTALSTQRAYIHIAPQPSAPGQMQAQSNGANKPGSVTSIPASQSDARALLLRHQLAALWTPRHMLSVQNGACYTGGLFSIYIGEVRALREGQGGGVSSPGVVVCISTTIGGEADEGVQSEGVDENGVEPIDLDFAQATIRELWGKVRAGRDLGRAEVKEVFMAPSGVGASDARPGTGGKGDETEAAVRMWCEVLRLRG